MRRPNIVRLTPDWIASLDMYRVFKFSASMHVPARTLPRRSLGRLRAAWLVLTGRADALVWPEDDRETYTAWEERDRDAKSYRSLKRVNLDDEVGYVILPVGSGGGAASVAYMKGTGGGSPNAAVEDVTFGGGGAGVTPSKPV